MPTSTRSSGTLGRASFAIGEIAVEVETDQADVLEEFSALYGAPDAPVSGPVIRMNVSRPRTAPWRRRPYRVTGDGATLSTPRSRDEILPYLEWGINRRVIERRAEFLQLHAATLVRDGHAMILAGDSEAGKSTLAAALLARGWQYLSDEFALIDPCRLRVHPYPKAVCLKSGSFGVIDELRLPVSRHRAYVKAWKGGVRYVRPEDVRADAVGAPSPVRWIVFPWWRPSNPPRLAPMTPARSLFRLSGMVLNRHVYGAHAISVLAGITRDARSFALEAGPIGPTCDVLDSLGACVTEDCDTGS